MSVNGKTKGSEFERVICKSLSNWWSHNTRTDLFWRTSNSGGRYTVRKKKGMNTYNQSGDICSTDPDTKCFSDSVYIECKSYKNIGLWSMFTGKGLLKSWLDIAYKNAKSEGKYVFLIVKENNRDILLFTDLLISECFELCTFYTTKYPFNSIHVYSFSSFLEIDPESFRDVYIYPNSNL